MRQPLLLFALLGAALLGTPAAAGAQAPVSAAACEAAGGPHAACVGVGKFGDRVAAECKRVGADPAQCATVVGRRVAREEISAFQGSPLARTLAFEQRLGDVLGLGDAFFAGTHNSFNAPTEDPTISHSDSNQQLTLTDQLDLGMRSLELDVHWIPSPRAGGAFAPVVCHGSGPVGCTTERLLSERLPEIATWLDAHPREVLLLYLEDQIDDPAGYEASAKAVRDAFGAKLYVPKGTGCTKLPLDLTRDALRAAGKQVIVTGGCGTGAWQAVSHSWPDDVRYEAGPEDFTAYPGCGGAKAIAARPHIVRYFEDSTLVNASMSATTPAGLTPEVVREMLRCGTDLLGFDQLVPGDARLPALAWSWRDGPPTAGDPTCTEQAADSRWEPHACATTLRPSCRRADGSWFVRHRAVTRAAAGPACRRARGAFRSPRTAFQNQLVRDAAGSGPVWIAYRPAPPAKRR